MQLKFMCYTGHINPLGEMTGMENVIVSLCRWREMTSDDLAKILKRSKAKLIRLYLSPMVERGVLIYKYPEMPRHPYQAYRVKPWEK